LVISNAPLKASIVDPGKVFIDVNNNGTYEAPTSTDAYDKDFIATAVTDTEATWTLSTAAAKKLVTTCGDTVSSCDIVVVADGTTPVEDQPEAPTATLNLKYSTGDRTTVSKLLHIKRNGTVCTLYNIPNSAAVDELSVRVTNMGTQDGLVLGTLRALDGTKLFTNKVLAEALTPNSTVRIDAVQLNTLAGGSDTTPAWTGRAILTLSSNNAIGNMEAYGLVRNKSGGPLMNISAGASGSGCD
jgi:hypothetical protein